MSNTGFQLKASSMTFTSLLLFTSNLDIVESQLAALVEKTPQFFNSTPILLDLTDAETRGLPLDLLKLLGILRRYRLSPIGVKSYNNEHKEIARANYLAIIAQTETEKAVAENKSPPQPPPEPKIVTAKLIDQPVRSGKQIYAKGCDLIITSTVSHGAEVLADGNIHIYGTLNGRALAGIQGDENARIFCKNLDAELIAIAGHYLVNEQISEEYKAKNHLLEIFLSNQILQFKEI